MTTQKQKLQAKELIAVLKAQRIQAKAKGDLSNAKAITKQIEKIEKAIK